MSLFEIYYKDKWEFKNLELTLSRIDGALDDAGFLPDRIGRVVHIAGTNGKGSSSLFLSQMLEKNGLQTALFTSPHISDVKERLAFGLKNIPSEDFDRLFKEYYQIINKRGLSYFEGIFFIALMWFSEKTPDVTILETGLGGRFDATNTNVLNDKICLITSVSQDHADILGRCIYKITDEKLGIIRESSKVFLGPNRDFIKEYIKSRLKNNITEAAASSFASGNYAFPYSENYSSAKAVADYAAGKTIEDIPGLKLPPCRLERHGNIILDGSHNPAGIMALIKSGAAGAAGAVIFTGTKERDLRKTFSLLSKISGRLILTSVPGNPRSISTAEAASVPCPFIENPAAALKEAQKNANGGDILVTGSFYLCGEIKKLISGAK